MIRKFTAVFINWFEQGELAPLIIIISVPHYAAVLARFDFWPVAAALGFLIDLGHYRTIRAYQRGQGALWMVVLTLFSFGFHTAFYLEGGAGWASVFFGLSVPVVIFALSFLSVAERWTAKARRAESAGNIAVSSAPAPELSGNVPGNMPELSAPSKTWRQLSEAERHTVALLSVSEIVAQYHVSERTARNWRRQ